VKNLKDDIVLNFVRDESSLRFFLNISFKSIPETPSLSADCLLSLLDVNVSGLSASQLYSAGVSQISSSL
ncbi:hypothetical protein ABKP09_15115, partial [Peribacillus frigoritolerans]|uniref:hypothetical protein n=1 Tax=Peribacillus frigoritolerans TaxID=450367 RepID=UPI0032B35969